jgi:hypothetical protein
MDIIIIVAGNVFIVVFWIAILYLIEKAKAPQDKAR